MGDLPSKLDKLLRILEIIAKHGELSANQLAKELGVKIGSIKIYIEYLEELGLIYTKKDVRTTRIKLLAQTVAKIGDTMLAAVDGKVVVWRCPFTEICPYFESGCTTADKCLFLSAFLPAINEALSKLYPGINQAREDDVTE